MENAPLISIVIVTYNSSDCISHCISSIVEYTKNISYEIIVVDNCSTDNTITIIRTFKNISLLQNNKNYGFATATNMGTKMANGKYIIILNPDIRFTIDTNIDRMIDFYEKNKKPGILAPRLYYTNNTIQESARKFPNIFIVMIRFLQLDTFFSGFAFYKKQLGFCNAREFVEVDWVLGAFMIIDKDIFASVNYFDEKFFMYYEDIDLCWRIGKKGLTVIYNPAFSAIHEYKRDSAKKIFSKIKMMHISSYLRFSFKRLNILKSE